MTENRHAILIASSRFQVGSGLTSLRCPEHDVEGMREILASPDRGGFTNVLVLKNKKSHEALDEIYEVFNKAGNNDLVLIYYSGHGKQDIEVNCTLPLRTRILGN